MLQIPSDSEKAAVWKAYQERRPTRVPLRWTANSRIVLLNPELNPEGYGYREFLHEPRVSLAVQARFAEYLATTLNRTCDSSCELPAQWRFAVESQNVYDAAYFGAEVRYEPGQVPCTHQFLTLDDVDAFLARDFSRPLENPWVRDRLAFRERLVAEAEHFSHLGRKGTVAAFGVGFDGPLTVAANLFGSDVFLLLAADPERAERLLRHITEACLLRNQALAGLAGGMLAADLALDITPSFFMQAMPGAVKVANLTLAVSKSVVFGVLIALVGCHYGLRVEPNTQSLGRGTTASVVAAITVVILVDAVFAIVFRSVGV